MFCVQVTKFRLNLNCKADESLTIAQYCECAHVSNIVFLIKEVFYYEKDY